MADWTKDFFREAVFSPGMPEALASAPGESRFVARALGMKRGDRLLDLCCGTGRHSHELARLGASVLGVDKTAAYLREARRRARGRGGARFVLGDMRQLAFRSEFDAAVCLWTSFGYFASPADDLTTLRGVARALRPGGLFLLDLLNAAWLRRHFQSRNWVRRADGTLVLEENTLREGKDPAAVNTWTVLKPGRRPARATLFVRLYDRARVERALRRAGLRPLRAWGGLAGEPFGAGSKRLVILARKA